MIALQTTHEGRSQLAGEIGVLAPCLLATTPTRIAENVDIGRPEGKPLVDQSVALPAECLVILGTALVGDGGGDALDERGIPGRGHADRLRKYGGAAIAPNAVERLAPEVVRRDAQAGDRRGIMPHLRDFLLQGHACQEVAHTLSDRP